jgi:hypothetical protein
LASQPAAAAKALALPDPKQTRASQQAATQAAAGAQANQNVGTPAVPKDGAGTPKVRGKEPVPGRPIRLQE